MVDTIDDDDDDDDEDEEEEEDITESYFLIFLSHIWEVFRDACTTEPPI